MRWRSASSIWRAKLAKAPKWLGAMTCTGRTQAENVDGREATDREVIYPFDRPLKERAGYLVLKGNLFDFAIMKTSVISEDFRARYLSNPKRT